MVVVAVVAVSAAVSAAVVVTATVTATPATRASNTARLRRRFCPAIFHRFHRFRRVESTLIRPLRRGNIGLRSQAKQDPGTCVAPSSSSSSFVERQCALALSFSCLVARPSPRGLRKRTQHVGTANRDTRNMKSFCSVPPSLLPLSLHRSPSLTLPRRPRRTRLSSMRRRRRRRRRIERLSRKVGQAFGALRPSRRVGGSEGGRERDRGESVVACFFSVFFLFLPLLFFLFFLFRPPPCVRYNYYCYGIRSATHRRRLATPPTSSTRPTLGANTTPRPSLDSLVG
jgi:hypothetical protein